ncbi:MAG: Ig-like domain-containing protein [Treponema sp.]|nr:Ig-like domain-containing protein [Treponema sp.]
MKKTLYKTTVTFLVLLIGLAGCPNFMEPPIPSPGEGKGFVNLQFDVDQSGRTILPPNYSFSFYQLSFTGNSNGAQDYIITNSTSGVNLNQLELVEGNWKLEVRIYLEAGRLTQIASASNIDVNVVRAGSVTVTVPLVFSAMSGGTGTLVWNITSDITPDSRDIKLTRLDATGTVTLPNLTGNNPAVPAGYYLVTIRLDKDLITSGSGARRAIWADILNIYPGQTTNLNRNFTADNFSNSIENVWLIVGSASYPMTENNLGYFSVQQYMAASDTFAFSLNNPASTTANQRAWFVPASTTVAAVTPGNNTMTFLANPSANPANARRWTLSNHGACTFTLNPVDWNFSFTQNIIYPVISVSLPATLTMIAGDTHQLTPVFNPTNATNKNVTWSIVDGGSEIISVSDNGLVTANGEGTASVRVTTQDGNRTADCIVTVIEPVNVIVPYTWRFGSANAIDGWEAFNNTNTTTQADTTMKTDAPFGNGMTITASEIAGATTTGMRWMPSQSGWSGGPVGCLQPNAETLLGQGRHFIKIDHVPGPFTITLNYASTGAANSGRFAQLYINGVKVMDGAATPGSNATSTRRQLVYDYLGTDRVNIQIGANSPIRLFEVILDRTPVQSVSLPASIDLLVGDTYQLVPVFTPAGATNKNVTWSVASGAGFASVSNSGLVTASAVGTATVRVTTQDGNRTAECTVNVRAAPPAGSGWVNIPLTVTDQGTGFIVSAPANTNIYKSGTPTAAEFIITNPVAGHTYTWYVNGEAVPSINNRLQVRAADYLLGRYNVRLTVQINNTFWSMPGSFNFTVLDRN